MLRSAARPHVLSLALAALLLSACGGSSVFQVGDEDGGNQADSGTGTSQDAGTHSDAGTHDAGTDAGVDAGADAGSGNDAGTGSDAGTHDAGTDAGTDAGVDAGTDGGAHPDGGTTTASCGNGILEGNEECDDGNNLNFDGCSSTCHVEQSQRVVSMQMQFGTDSVCPINALGGAIQSLGQSQLQTALNTAVANGSISILMTLVGATDSSGVNQSGLTIGILGGDPEEPAGSPTYSGTSDLDWWYLPDSASIDSTGEPTAKISGSAAGGTLSAGPGSFTLPLSLGGGVTNLAMSAATLHTPIGSLSAPLESTNGLPPGHLASEHVSPSFRSVQTTGSTTSSNAGTLCGNVSAGSLATALLPSAVVSACNNVTYTTSNSILDLLISGCTFYGIAVVNKAQPDKVDSAQPVAGAGAPYKLSASSGVTVDTCKDKAGTKVDLTQCLTAAAYSSYFMFGTDRVIIQR